MKRNLISIVILALLVVNIVLTAIMMFSVVSTNRKTADLVGDVAAAISLDIDTGEQVNVPLEDTTTYTIADMRILLKKSVDENGVQDENDHYAMLTLVLSMDTKHDDYAKYGEQVTEREDLIKGTISDVVSQYTMEEAKSNPDKLRQDVLKGIQDLYDSTFIFDVTLVSPLYQ